MSEFNPSPNDHLSIGGTSYQVMPHPSVPAFAFGQEGRKAFVYQMMSGSDGQLFALKKFKQAYRVPELVDVCDALARYSTWPGLEVCARHCLHNGPHNDALGEFPDLEFAVLMPWIGGSTWYDVVIGSKPITRLDALTIAHSTAQVLSALEEAGLAHCDIAAPNVIVNLATGQTHLIDIEDLYAPGFQSPAALPAGTEGYAHRTAHEGLWMPTADRFAGAVLLAEMAAWHSPEIRKASDEEHYFATDDMQADNPRTQLMLRTLGDMDQRLADLFNQAWQSQKLEDSPRLKAWQEVLSELAHREQLSKVVSDWQPIAMPGAGDSAAAAPAKPIKKPVRPEQPKVEPQLAPKPIAAPTAQPQAVAPAPVLAPTPMQPAKPKPSGAIPPMPTTGPVVEWRPLPTAPSKPVENGSISPEIAASEAMTPETVTMPGLIKPLLDLSHVDKRHRPFLVWTESPGAENYLLHEAKSPNFEPVKEHRTKPTETRWNPTLGRSGELYYRVQACAGDQVSEWSDTLIVRIAS